MAWAVAAPLGVPVVPEVSATSLPGCFGGATGAAPVPVEMRSSIERRCRASRIGVDRDSRDVRGDVPHLRFEVAVEEYGVDVVAFDDLFDRAGGEAGVEQYQVRTQLARGHHALDHRRMVAGENRERAVTAETDYRKARCQAVGALGHVRVGRGPVPVDRRDCAR